MKISAILFSQGFFLFFPCLKFGEVADVEKERSDKTKFLKSKTVYPFPH